ncbi:hypothetical protein Pelo_19053 [Pelomyxa schiedti]|nr:hypothetical protein Pelo_19053 [Pelomyxa schiedti]
MHAVLSAAVYEISHHYKSWPPTQGHYDDVSFVNSEVLLGFALVVGLPLATQSIATARHPQQHRVWVVHTPTAATATGDEGEGEGGTRAAMVAAEEGWSGHDLASCILGTPTPPGGSPHPSHHSHNQLGIPNVAPDDLLIALHGDYDCDVEDTPPPVAALRKYATVGACTGTGTGTSSTVGGATAAAAVAASWKLGDVWLLDHRATLDREFFGLVGRVPLVVRVRDGAAVLPPSLKGMSPPPSP